jgi:hypothetical protein
MKLNIAKQFSKTPGPRYEAEGPYAGAVFRDTLLYPLLEEAVLQGERLVVELDGTAGYGAGFLEEAFGGLIRRGVVKEPLLQVLVFKSDEEPYLIDEILSYINDAAAQSPDTKGCRCGECLPPEANERL